MLVSVLKSRFVALLASAAALLPSSWRRGRRRQRALPQERALKPQDLVQPQQLQRPKFRDWNDRSTIERAWTESETVFICINRNSTAVASVPWHVEREVAPDRWEPDLTHPLNRLLRQPNPEWSWRHFIKALSEHCYLHGNGLVDINRTDAGEPWELWLLRPSITFPIPAGPGSERLIEEYEVRNGHQIRRVPATDVVHLQEIPDPDNLYWGCSRLRAGGKAVDIEIECREFQKYGLQNRAVLSAIVTPASDPPLGTSPLGKKEAQDEKTSFETNYKGAKKAGKIVWSSGRVEYHDLSKTPKEMDFTEGRDFIRETICSLYDMPPPIIGILSRATYNNTPAVERIWLESAIIPHLAFLRDGLNRGFVAREWPDDKVRLNFDTSRHPAFSARFAEKISQAKQLKDLGWSDEEIEARLDLGRPNISGASRQRNLRSVA